MKFLIYKDATQHGPFPRAEVDEHLKAGTFTPDDYAWTDGQSDWRPLSEVLDGAVPSPAGDSAVAGESTASPAAPTRAQSFLQKAKATAHLTHKQAARKKLELVELRRAHHRLGKKAYESGLSLPAYGEIISRLDTLRDEIAALRKADASPTATSLSDKAKGAARATAKAAKEEALNLKQSQLLTELGSQLHEDPHLDPSLLPEVNAAKAVSAELVILNAEIADLASRTPRWARRPLLVVGLLAAALLAYAGFGWMRGSQPPWVAKPAVEPRPDYAAAEQARFDAEMAALQREEEEERNRQQRQTEVRIAREKLDQQRRETERQAEDQARQAQAEAESQSRERAHASTRPLPADPPANFLPFYAEAETKFAEFFRPKIKAMTDATVSFDGTVTGDQWLVTETREFRVAITREWLYPRFGILVPDRLTEADAFNGKEFQGIAAIEADAVRLTPAEDTPPAALDAASRRQQLDGKWHPPGNGSYVAKYSVQRTAGVWKIEPYRGTWSSAWDAPREHWLCAKPRPPAPIVDGAALQAEAQKAFEKCQQAVSADGFTLLFRADVDRTEVKEHLIEFRGTAKPRFQTVPISAAERHNGIEQRFDLRMEAGAYRYKEINVRARREDEAIPRTYCSTGGTKVTDEWAAINIWTIHAEKEHGTWHLTDSYGELMPAH